MARNKKPPLEESARALRKRFGDTVTFHQIVEFEKEVGYIIGVNLPLYMDRVSRGVWRITDESIARYTNGTPPPAKAAKAPKQKKVKAPVSSTTATVPEAVAVAVPVKKKSVKVAAKPKKAKAAVAGKFSKMYDQLVDLRKDFEALGVATVENRSYVFRNKFGNFNMVNGVLYNQVDPDNDPHKFEMVQRKNHGTYLNSLLEG